MTDTKSETIKKSEEIRYRIRPTRHIDYNCGTNDWEMEFQLPGVDKNNINLKFLPNSYILKARRDQALFQNSECFPFEIETDSIEAEYNNGLLYIKGKIKNPMDNSFKIPVN